MDNPWLTVATVVTVAVLRLMGDVIRWLAARSGERLRARTLAELVSRTAPGTVLTDRRPDGAALTIRRPDEREGEREERGGRGGRDGGDRGE
ncbi:hypothetical protein JBE04_35885 [Streptomyces sp. PRKS01-29]|nr:hypothetical protein [Streptomyces sabulosicollis]MBI0299697.1 hypothetical protein [Streptomyces sabulosicollis]